MGWPRIVEEIDSVMWNNDSLDDTPVMDGSTSFADGVVSDSHPRKLTANQAALMVNMDLQSNGEAVTRRGCARIGTGKVEDGGAGSGGVWIQGLFPYNTTGVNRLIAINNRVLWKNTGGAWSSASGYAAGALPGHTQIPVAMAQGIGKLYLADVFSNITQWDGTTFTNLGSGGATQPPFGASSLQWHTERLVAAGFGQGGGPDSETIAFSDILDPATWDLATQNIVVGKGDGDPILGIIGWSDFNLIVFKRRSLWIVNCNPANAVADFPIKRIREGLGVLAPRTAVQVGEDVFVLTTHGVRSVRSVIAAEDKQDLGPSLSVPVDDIIRRINPAMVSQCNAVAWNDRYILFLPLDSSTYPNYALVYNTQTDSWSGYWTGWNATFASTRVVSNGTVRMVFGDAFGYVREWLDYEATETLTSYQDDGVNISSQLETKAFVFDDPQSPKTGFNYEIEYAHNSFASLLAPTVVPFESGATIGATKSFDAVNGTTRRQAFDLQAAGQFREVQFRFASTRGKMSLKRVVASAFLDSLVLQT